MQNEVVPVQQIRRNDFTNGSYAAQEDLESFRAFLVLLKDSYQDQGEIPRTVIQLLHMYHPEDGSEAYLKLVRVLCVLLENMEEYILKYLISIIPPPNCDDGQDITSLLKEVERITKLPLLRTEAFHTRVLPELSLPHSISVKEPTEVYPYTDLSETPTAVSASTQQILKNNSNSCFVHTSFKDADNVNESAQVFNKNVMKPDFSQTKMTFNDNNHIIPSEKSNSVSVYKIYNDVSTQEDIRVNSNADVSQSFSFSNNNVYATSSSGSESCTEEIESHNYKFYVLSTLEAADLCLTTKSTSNYALKYVRRQNNLEQEFLSSMDTVNVEYNPILANSSVRDDTIKLEDITESMRDLCYNLMSGNMNDEDMLAASIKSFLSRTSSEIEDILSRKPSRNHKHKINKRSKLNTMLMNWKGSEFINPTNESSKVCEMNNPLNEGDNALASDTNDTEQEISVGNISPKVKSKNNSYKQIQNVEDTCIENELETNINMNSNTMKKKQAQKRRITRTEGSKSDNDETVCDSSSCKKAREVDKNVQDLDNGLVTCNGSTVHQDDYDQNDTSNMQCDTSNQVNNEDNVGTSTNIQRDLLINKEPEDVVNAKEFEEACIENTSHISESDTAPTSDHDRREKEHLSSIISDICDPPSYGNQISSDYFCYLQNVAALKKSYEQSGAISSDGTMNDESVQNEEADHPSTTTVPFSCSNVLSPSHPQLSSSVYSQQHCKLNDRVPMRSPVPNQFALPLTTWASYCAATLLRQNKGMNLQHPSKMQFTTKRGSFVSIPVEHQSASSNMENIQGPNSHTPEMLRSTPILCNMEATSDYSSLSNNQTTTKRSPFGSMPYEYQSNLDYIPKSHNSDLLRSTTIPCSMDTPSNFPPLPNSNPYIMKTDSMWRNYHTIRQYPGTNPGWSTPWARAAGRPSMMQPGFPSSMSRNMDPGRSSFSQCSEGFWEPTPRMYQQAATATMGQMSGIPHSPLPTAAGFSSHQRTIPPGIFHLYPDCSTNTHSDLSRPTQAPQHKRKKLEEIVDLLKEVEKNH